MNEIQEKLSTERTLKKFLRESNFTFLEKLRERINTALNEKRAEHEEQERQREIKKEKRNELLALMESEGFAPEDFITSAPKKSRPKRKLKYSYSVNGETKYWSGVGRTPVGIQKELDEGKTLESFLIEPTGD